MLNILPYNGILPKMSDGVFLAPGAWVIGDVTIGTRSSIWFNTVVRGDEHYIRIGEETNIQDNSTLHVTGGKYPLEIGSRVTIGHRAIVHGCVVEDDCLIGMGAIIMDGAVVQSNSIIAAGAVVKEGTIVGSGTVWAGVPAQKVKDIDERLLEGQVKRISGNYQKYASWYD